MRKRHKEMISIQKKRTCQTIRDEPAQVVALICPLQNLTSCELETQQKHVRTASTIRSSLERETSAVTPDNDPNVLTAKAVKCVITTDNETNAKCVRIL